MTTLCKQNSEIPSDASCFTLHRSEIVFVFVSSFTLYGKVKGSKKGGGDNLIDAGTCCWAMKTKPSIITVKKS